MENWQLQRLRDGLAAYRSLGDGTRQLTWTDVESDIELETGVHVPEKRLSKFVIGEPHKDKDLKALGVRNYPALYDYRLKAVISFLTEKKSKGFMFSLDDLKIYPTDLGLLRLSEYLNGSGLNTTTISTSNFSGIFTSINQNSDFTNEWLLRFSDAVHQNFIPCAIVTVPKNSQLMPESTEQELKNIPGALRYKGWGIKTQKENLLLLTQKERNGENLMFISMEIDTFYHYQHGNELTDEVNTLILLMHDQPHERSIIDRNDSPKHLVDQIIQSWQKNLLIFSRMNDGTSQKNDQSGKK